MGRPAYSRRLFVIADGAHVAAEDRARQHHPEERRRPRHTSRSRWPSRGRWRRTRRPRPGRTRYRCSRLLVSHFARPRTPIMEASVTMNGWIRECRDHHAVQRAGEAGRRDRRRIASAICAVGIAATSRVRHIAATAVESARMLPTLRSMPPVRMTNVMASEIMPISEIWRRMSVRLPAWRKMREPSGAVRADRDGQNARMPAAPPGSGRAKQAVPARIGASGAGLRRWWRRP